MKKLMVLFVTMIMLFSYATLASAELLFGVSAETGKVDFSADYAGGSENDFTESPKTVMLNGELNLVLTRVYLEYGQTDLERGSFSSYGLKTGWELGPGILKAQLLGGLQGYKFEDDKLAALGSNSVIGLVGGVGLESKIGNLKIYGSALIPLLVRFSSDIDTDNSAGIENYCIGISYAPIPMLDIFANYRNTVVESKFLTLESEGYTVGAKISF